MLEQPHKAFLTIKEAAPIARIHPQTLYKLIRDDPKNAPPFGRVRRAIRLPTQKFYLWLERRK